MSSKSNDKGKWEEGQGEDWSDAEWEELVKEQLPADLELKAIELKAWQRRRGIGQISDLLRGLLVYACCGYSFQVLGIWATLKGIANISETAWRTRLHKSAAWIDWLLRAMLSQGNVAGLEWLKAKGVCGRINLVDATRLKTVGGTGDDLRLHSSYSLLEGRMQQVEITDRHQAESLKHFQMRKGDIAVLDAGYAVPTTIEEADAQGLGAVLRATASHLRLETVNGEVIKLKDQLKRQAYGVVRRIKGQVKTANGKSYAVSLIAYRLPKPIALCAMERKRQRLKAKRGRNFNQELVWWAGWVLVVTNLPEELWSAEEILRLYRARWQIELIFKRLKQILDLHRIPIEDWARACIVAQLHLIVWLLQEGVQHLLRQQFQLLEQPADSVWGEEHEEENEPAGVLSSWSMAFLSVDQVRSMLRGSWPTKRILACLDQLARYLFTRPRQKRPHQQTDLQAWLSTKLSAFAANQAA
jgi:IS4 transposase